MEFGNKTFAQPNIAQTSYLERFPSGGGVWTDNILVMLYMHATKDAAKRVLQNEKNKTSFNRIESWKNEQNASVNAFQK